MQSVHRQFGKFMKRSADDSQVSVLLKDFDEADKLLAKIIESTKAWRDAWVSILTYQGRLVNEFEVLYAPIVGSSDTSNTRPSVATPPAILARTNRLNEEYESLRTDLLEEVNAVDSRMIQPAQRAKELIAPLKKTIKKREDKKLDFEHYQNRVDNSLKKAKRSDRDNAALAKAEIDLSRAKEEYNAADENLRQRLPPLIAAVFSLLPHILDSQINIQYTLLANYYTVLHTYSEEEQFPSPPPAMEQVIQDWKGQFLPVQQEAEGFACIANGKAIRTSDDRRSGSHSNGIGARRPSNNRQLSASSSATSPNRGIPPPAPNLDTKPRMGDYLSTSPSPNPTHLSPPSPDYSSSIPQTSSIAGGNAPAGPRGDYFSRERQPSSSSNVTTPGGCLGSIAKKKPPPPPPPRAPSATRAVYVTALYDFGGQGQGDLVFREGDRIRVIKKTDSTDDWWEGELHGIKGSFPANYCQ
ncbi:SH3 domain-containing protein [Talaromyces proteolyticus]|uniref:SH3 domain-containing protein n=1 Tax=Talaromyces proteolyticus TaxID=1131652 RepID=A0AAD4Q486_9EURO|nr:SH3 domain-containing protein [Talaromyces proteolyticus]KAH8702427.1 SH3 domain-containing protein [Talaromyces proteolyticus]